MIIFGIGIASQGVMNLLDDDLFLEVVDDIEALGELAEDNKDFLKSLENKAEEVEDEPDSID